MSTEVAERKTVSLDIQEKVLIGGDLSKLTIPERLSYYNNLCESLGLNPLTSPFEYITLNGKLRLYAKKDCTDQLRRVHGVSVLPNSTRIMQVEDVRVVVVSVQDKTGRTDEGTGAVPIAGLKGEALANAIMKCETKAKRRATLSICGLGMLDETELETIPKVAVIPQVRPRNDATMVQPADKYTGEPIRQEDGAGNHPEPGHKQSQGETLSQKASDAPAPKSAQEFCMEQAAQAPESAPVPVIGFGKYRGKAIDDPSIPDDYLAWLEPRLVEQMNDPNLSRYRHEKELLLDALRGVAMERGILIVPEQ